MKDNKLFRLLRPMDKKELKRFEDYLQGFYASHGAAVALFGHIRRFHPAYDSPKLDNRYLLDRVLGLKGAPEKRVLNERSKLYRWLQEFLVWEKLQSSSHQYDYDKLLMQVFKEKKLEEGFRRQARKAHAALLKKPESTRLPLQLMEIAHEQYYHTPTRKLQPENPLITEAAVRLNEFYRLQKLKYDCELLSRRLALHENSEGRAGGGKLSLLHLYQLCMELLEKGEEQPFNALRQALHAPAKAISREDEHVLLSYLINFAARQLLQGKKGWHQKAFELYQYGMEKDILLTDGYISSQAFHNIVQLACELQQFKWAAAFIRQYCPFLRAESRHSTVCLAKARLAFGKGKYEEACALLRELKFEDTSFALLAKLLEVRSYFELEKGYSESLEYAVNAFDNYLRRDGVIRKESTLQGYKNFLKTIKMMAKGASRQEVAAAVEGYEFLVCKAWVDRKLQSFPD